MRLLSFPVLISLAVAAVVAITAAMFIGIVPLSQQAMATDTSSSTQTTENASMSDTPQAATSIYGTDPENTLIMETTQGKVVIKLRPDLAPKHVARIKELARQKFYDGITFHRVIEGFMAQTGDPKGNGTGGSGQNIEAEFTPEPYVRGTVGMARAQHPNSGDSQFFITFGDAGFLNNNYTVWGKVIAGMEYVDKIKRGEPVPEPRDSIKTMRVLADVDG